MPEVSRFFGISIIFYYNDHAPPHFHASYEGDKAVFDIRTLQMTEGWISNRAQGLVIEWASQHGETDDRLGQCPPRRSLRKNRPAPLISKP